MRRGIGFIAGDRDDQAGLSIYHLYLLRYIEHLIG